MDYKDFDIRRPRKAVKLDQTLTADAAADPGGEEVGGDQKCQFSNGQIDRQGAMWLYITITS